MLPSLPQHQRVSFSSPPSLGTTTRCKRWLFFFFATISCSSQLHHDRSNAFVVPNCSKKRRRTARTIIGDGDREIFKATDNDDDKNCISSGESDGTTDENSTTKKDTNTDFWRDNFRKLAEWSLKDYDWRQSLFQTNEADKKMEQSLARMLGEDPSYVRPMDASEQTIGPLGKTEKNAVEWLSKVIDEEGRRARKIVNTDGELVRPIDAGIEDTGELGPLGFLEKRVADFLQSIRKSERLRVQNGLLLRPKDLDKDIRGPLGDFEVAVSTALRNIQDAELLRMEQSKYRGGEIVRPIDVPGPLGELEMALIDVIREEKLRSQKGISRPKDAERPGKLGEVELQAVEIVQRLTDEEKERLKNIQKVLLENRPMVRDKDSVLGEIELIGVGIFRLLKAIYVNILRAVERVKGLFQSETNINDSSKVQNKADQSSDGEGRKNGTYTEFQ